MYIYIYIYLWHCPINCGFWGFNEKVQEQSPLGAILVNMQFLVLHFWLVLGGCPQAACGNIDLCQCCGGTSVLGPFAFI